MRESNFAIFALTDFRILTRNFKIFYNIFTATWWVLDLLVKHIKTGDAYMRRQTWSASVEVMACRHSPKESWIVISGNRREKISATFESK